MVRVGTLALVGGAFQTLGAVGALGLSILLGTMYNTVTSMGMPIISPVPLITHALLIIGIIGVIVGISSIYISIKLRGGAIDPRTGGAVLIALAIASYFTCFAGGFIIGMVLGIIDGVRALRS